ncbi:hypothetical protein PIB30_072764 [Stylosanthes scabra]|uniref:Uncharacterized protein n=1 Tax=Stylosanthes scabra TaxID=79078 RepID=A0ABU6UNN0_9FABA|nr:hypothetical protein [Stylosanthes scabra]
MVKASSIYRHKSGHWCVRIGPLGSGFGLQAFLRDLLVPRALFSHFCSELCLSKPETFECTHQGITRYPTRSPDPSLLAQRALPWLTSPSPILAVSLPTCPTSHTSSLFRRPTTFPTGSLAGLPTAANNTNLPHDIAILPFVHHSRCRPSPQ